MEQATRVVFVGISVPFAAVQRVGGAMFTHASVAVCKRWWEFRTPTVYVDLAAEVTVVDTVREEDPQPLKRVEDDEWIPGVSRACVNTRVSVGFMAVT
jgi:hypothetical protein